MKLVTFSQMIGHISDFITVETYNITLNNKQL